MYLEASLSIVMDPCAVGAALGPIGPALEAQHAGTRNHCRRATPDDR